MTPRATNKFSAVSAFVASGFLLSSCASIINGSNQTVMIASTPPGAQVSINGTDSGVTPMKAELSRKSSHRVELNLRGHRPYEAVLEPNFNCGPIGNVLVGGVIGMAVDGSTGAGNTLKPEAIDAKLQKN